ASVASSKDKSSAPELLRILLTPFSYLLSVNQAEWRKSCAISSHVKVRSGMDTGPCRPILAKIQADDALRNVVIIRSKFSSDPRPERVRQIHSGFYYAPDFGRNAELRISSNCSPIPKFRFVSSPQVIDARSTRIKIRLQCHASNGLPTIATLHCGSRFVDAFPRR